jgi:hypothetical protein
MAQRTRRVHLTPTERQAAMEAALRAATAPATLELADEDMLEDVDEADIIREDVETLEAANHLEWTTVDVDLGDLGLAQLEAAALEASAREASRLEAARAAALPPPSSRPAPESLTAAALPLPPARRARVSEPPAAPVSVAPASAPPTPVPSSFRQEWKGTPRMQLGKETLQVLAPIMVKQLARPAAPPPRFRSSAGLLAAAAAVAAVLLTASAAMAWT